MPSKASSKPVPAILLPPLLLRRGPQRAGEVVEDDARAGSDDVQIAERFDHVNRHREVGVLENAEVAGVGHRAVHHDPVEPEVFDQPDRLLEHPRPVERVKQVAGRVSKQK